MKHSWKIIGLAWLTCLVGCNHQTNPSPKTDSATAAQTTNNAAGGKILVPVEIQLNWKPEAEHGGYYAALVHGFYADEGLDVKLLPGGPATPLMESVATERLAFGIDNADKLLRARGEGAEVAAVFAPIADSPRCVMVHAESGIKKLSELGSVPGMTLSWNTSQPYAQYLSKMLDLSHMQQTKYAGVGPFLLDKKYALQAYNISEPFLAKQQGAEPVMLMLSELGFNTYTSLLLTNPATLKNDPELVRKVIRASQRGWGRYLNDSAETNQRIAELNPEMPVEVLNFGAEQLNQLCHFGPKYTGYGLAGLNSQTGQATVPAASESHLGRMSMHNWETLVSQLESIELIQPGTVPAAKAFTNEFLPETK